METTIDIATENCNLLKKGNKLLLWPNTINISSKSFVTAKSFLDEFKLTLQRSLLISVQMLSELGSNMVSIIMVGQLPDSALYLSGIYTHKQIQ